MSYGWEGNRTSGVIDFSGLSTYGLNGLQEGDEHPTYTPLSMAPLYLYLFTLSLPVPLPFHFMPVSLHSCPVSSARTRNQQPPVIETSVTT